MAEEQQSLKRSRMTVPVRDRDQRAEDRRAHKDAQKKLRMPRVRISTTEIAVLCIVSLLILGTIATPLRNYYQGTAEMRRVTAAIGEKSAEKERLLAELERYQDEEYVRQQARQRLGVIEPGETAYRILDPGMEHAPRAEEHPTDEAQPAWYAVLWDAISVDKPVIPAEAPSEPAESAQHSEESPVQLQPEQPDAPADPAGVE